MRWSASSPRSSAARREKEAAIELTMKTHGGRSFLKGHLLGDNMHDFLAPCIYEGEGEVLGLAFFKSLVKEHGREFFEPISKALLANKIDPKRFNPLNPAHRLGVAQELGAYARWKAHQAFVPRDRQRPAGVDRRLQPHVDLAIGLFARHRKEITATMVKHQLKLADRQCRMAELSHRVQDTLTMLVTAAGRAGRGRSDHPRRRRGLQDLRHADRRATGRRILQDGDGTGRRGGRRRLRRDRRRPAGRDPDALTTRPDDGEEDRLTTEDTEGHRGKEEKKER
ncbi:MAG: hypothetical protein U0736_14530 [Gemmataceae bacterium]